MRARVPAPATMAIAALTVLAWLVAGVMTSPQSAAVDFGFIPARFGGLAGDMAAFPAFLTPLSSTLIHAGLLHIGFNMLMFLWCGAAVERVLGSAALVLIYIVGAYAAALAQYAIAPSSMVPMVGASGAVSAVVGAFALSFGRAKPLTRSPRLNRLINSAWLLVSWILLQVAIGWLAGSEGYALATPAHVGGFLAGLLLQRPLLLWRYRSA